MKKIIIVSNDICAVKQIVNAKNKVKKLNSFQTNIYDIIDFKNYILSGVEEANIAYFIDIYNIEEEFLDIINHLRKIDSAGKIIILSTNKNLKSLLESQNSIYSYVEKDINFNNKILEILFMLSNNEKSKINITNTDISINLNRKIIDGMYNWPNDQLSINYKHGDNNLLVTSNNYLNKKTKNKFYTDKYEIYNSKRNYYYGPIKQLLVDLYFVFHMDYKELSRYFKVDASYIKRWSNLSKYRRKFNFIKYIIGKIIINSYLKK